MISKKQNEANCRNAQLSTGPKTEEGKAVVRLNALRHGLRARSILLPGENVEDYHQLCADLKASWQLRDHNGAASRRADGRGPVETGPSGSRRA